MKTRSLLSMRSKGLAILLAILLVLPLAASFSFNGVAFAEGEVSFSSSYSVGETVAIPQRNLSDGSKAYPASAFVIAPSGVTVRTNSAVLNEAGKYTIEYRAAADNGTVLTESYSFISVGRLFSVGGSKSSAEYGTVSYGDFEVNRPGIAASIARKDTFKYNKLIDLADLGGSSFISFYVTPETIGTCDAENIFIMLTDAYDPTNVVTFTLKKGFAAEAGAAWAERNCYIQGNAVDQVASGLEKNKAGGAFIFDGIVYALQMAGVWGANLLFAMPGNPQYQSLLDPRNEPQYVGSQTLSLSIDLDTNWLYAISNAALPQIVTNLAMPEIYGKNLWGGFTTGEVYLSISADKYNGEALGIVITNIGGEEVTEEEFAANSLLDSDAPIITVDTSGIDGGIPSAVAGAPYRVFPAAAFDSYGGSRKVAARVFSSYGTAAQVEQNVVGGAFTPGAAGDYVIEYTASDHYGNTATETISVTAEASSAAQLQINTGVSGALSVDAGQQITLPQPSFANARGETSLSIEAVLRQDSSVRYTVPTDTLVIRPEYTGAYDIVYSYGDYVFSKTATETLNVATTQKPVILANPVFPKYVLKDCTMSYPEISGYIYSSGKPELVTAEVYVKEDGGAEQKLSRPKYNTSASSTLEIIYRIQNGSQKAEITSGALTVVDAGYGGDFKMKEYFHTAQFTSEANKDLIRYTASTTGNAEMEFINTLQVFDFSLRLAAKETYFSNIEITLTDSQNPDIAVMLKYYSSGTRVYFAVNNGTANEVPNAVFNNVETPLSLTYQNGTRMVSPIGSSALAYEVLTDLAGNDFTGFPSSKVYMSVRLTNITGAASVDMLNINGQKLSSMPLDIVKPMLSAVSDSGDKRHGQEYTIPAVYMADVLDPAATYYMEVIAPDGSYAKTLDGTVLKEGANPAQNHVLMFDQYGSYRVIYSAKDNSNDPVLFEYILKVVDMTPPTVTILSPKTTGSVGQKIDIARIRIADDVSTELSDFTVFASVRLPCGEIKTLLDASDPTNLVYGKSFTAGAAGDYIVTYVVIDANGNAAFTSYTVHIS